MSMSLASAGGIAILSHTWAEVNEELLGAGARGKAKPGGR